MKQQKIPDTLLTARRFYHHFVDNKNVLQRHKFRFHSLLICKLFQSSSVFDNEVFGPGSDIRRKTLKRVFGSGNDYCACHLIKCDMNLVSRRKLGLHEYLLWQGNGGRIADFNNFLYHIKLTPLLEQPKLGFSRYNKLRLLDNIIKQKGKGFAYLADCRKP